jgi:hypothetical protein
MRSTITYRFNRGVTVAEVLLIQHRNGISKIEGFVGSDEDHLQSIGTASSSLGDSSPSTFNFFLDGYHDLFKFQNPREGKVFRLLITKTSLNNGYALYRAYPRDRSHKAFDVLRLDEIAGAY